MTANLADLGETVEFIGYVGHFNSSETVPRTTGALDPGFIEAAAKAQEHVGSDRVLVAFNLHTNVLDGVIQVEAEKARRWAQRSARLEGVLVGISSGATLAAIAKRLPEGATALGFNYDTGERCLSAPDFLPV